MNGLHGKWSRSKTLTLPAELTPCIVRCCINHFPVKRPYALHVGHFVDFLSTFRIGERLQCLLWMWGPFLQGWVANCEIRPSQCGGNVRRIRCYIFKWFLFEMFSQSHFTTSVFQPERRGYCEDTDFVTMPAETTGHMAGGVNYTSF